MEHFVTHLYALLEIFFANTENEDILITSPSLNPGIGSQKGCLLAKTAILYMFLVR